MRSQQPLPLLLEIWHVFVCVWCVPRRRYLFKTRHLNSIIVTDARSVFASLGYSLRDDDDDNDCDDDDDGDDALTLAYFPEIWHLVSAQNTG